MRELKTMNKVEFLTRLRNRLVNGGMATDDINDALTYYDEVFLDAGFGKEEETAAAMGSPEEVAVNLLRESGIHVDPAPAMPPQNPQMPYPNAYAYAQAAPPPKQKSAGFTAAMVILAILSFPIWLPILITVVAVLFSFIVALIAVAFGLVAGAVGMLIGGIVCLVAAPPIGMMLIGIALFFTGLIILICKPIFSAVIPAIGRAIKRFCSWLVGLFKKGGKTNE
jgi:uncharacterized membrane protein